ncbi:hypothetical protein ABB37_09187 [Leptomonas pyrrhocoris]|uniref:Uncharacterized protein n=1 Tax=Leptomonas pyrrhocoris TaxID=157538 RepID=A0A0M9FRF4_LEPPY|nr:hypothetical protein ABB37_09187 [Leptomonas pyrrhocoris]KPA74535.1 hypothetical protein ABB37_09187 [Leptomonas pyrrhocoris]|eukprot:XP_015652974.1 hypothetical protein ABB37_09187 [Leptomonas pyrrhocoris]
MGKRKNLSTAETSPELDFVRGGTLNTIVYREGEELQRLPVDSAAFLEDKRAVRSSNMDQITFSKNIVFKVTLDFVEPMACMPEIAVRETTDWMLMTCPGTSAYYATVDQRLVLQQCQSSLQSNIPELTYPITIILYLDDDQWLVERVLR